MDGRCLQSTDLATLFGTTAWVFNEFESQGASVKDGRLVHGVQAGDGQQSTGTTSFAASVKGKPDAFGYFVPSQVTATIHRGSAAGVFTGTLVTTKLVK